MNLRQTPPGPPARPPGSDDGEPTQRRRRLMVEQQVRRRGVQDARVLAAMEALPRHAFVPPGAQTQAYDDCALPIGWGQTISQPYMVALMLSLLELEPEHRVLEVGAGSGYAAALLGMLAAEVYALELVPELAERAAQTVRGLGLDNVHIVAGDGTRGYPPAQPFDRILVSAAAPEVPEPLVAQLAEGGTLLAPVGGRSVQTCRICTKRQGRLESRHGIDCVFVPLRGEHGWRDGWST